MRFVHFQVLEMKQRERNKLMNKYYYHDNNRHGSFHFISNDTYVWLCQQPYVKEESITDRIIFELNSYNPYVVSYEFNRNEEALNGADWEWWILFNKMDKGKKSMSKAEQDDCFAALRFRVQAKKLSRADKDNYHLFHYANKKGLQIDLLRERAKRDRAYALYALYTNYQNVDRILKYEIGKERIEVPNICSSCKNGVFLLSADFIYEKYIEHEKREVTRSELVKQSIPASIIDCFISLYHRYYFKWESHEYYYPLPLPLAFSEIKRAFHSIEPTAEIIHTKDEFPGYLKRIISRIDDKQEMDKQYYDEYLEGIEQVENETISGVGVIDLRMRSWCED